MLERMLSRPGRFLFLAITLPIWAYFLYGTFTNTGLPSYLNTAQGAMFDGKYSPKLTMALSMFPAIAIGFPFGLAFDCVTGQGIFARGRKK